jgi:hypothetical protein
MLTSVIDVALGIHSSATRQLIVFAYQQHTVIATGSSNTYKQHSANDNQQTIARHSTQHKYLVTLTLH